MEIGNRDLDKIDPDWRFAYFHAKSTKPGICTDQKPEHCDCCLNIIHKDPVDIGVHTKELEFLGFGFPLWFSFLKFCIVLTIILIVSEASVSLFQAVHMNKQFCVAEYNTFHGFMHSHSPQEAGKELHGHIHSMKLTLKHHKISLLRKYMHDSEHSSEQTTHEEPTQTTSENSSENSEDDAKESEEKKGTSLLDSSVNEGEHGEEDHEEGHQEGHVHCTGIFILMSRIDADIDELQSMLRVSTFIIILFTLLFIRDTIYKTQQYYDQRRCSLGDYSLIISKLPQTEGIQAMIRKFFREAMAESYHIEEMILLPELKELEEVQHEKGHHIQQLQKLYKEGKEHHQKEIEKVEHEIEENEEREKRALEDFEHQLSKDQLYAEKAIVVLSSEPEKELFMEQFHNLRAEEDGRELIQFFGPQGVDIEIKRAPEPREIIWQNIDYPSSKRFGRVLLGWSLSAVFIAIITGVFYLILKWKTHVAEEQSLRGATIIVFVALVLVILFNKFVMGHVLHYFTHLQKHATSDNQQLSFAFKYALGMFFTTALMTLFVEAITYGNFYTHDYGVIEQQSIMFFMNSLLVPIIWAINPFQIAVLIRRKLNFGKKHLTQREANHIMQDFHYDVGKRYAEVLETMWFTFLYATLIPFGAFLTVIGIGLYYWVDKYNLLRRSSIKQNVSGKLSISALRLLDLVLVFYPLGQIIFDHFLRHQINISSVVQLIVGIIYICLPLNHIIDFFNKENFYLEEKLYRDVKESFKDNYFDLHPMYSKLNPEQNSESRRLYKDHVMKQYANPVFSFVTGWLNNKNLQSTAFGKHLTNMKSTKGESTTDPNTATLPGGNDTIVKHMHRQFE